MIIGNPAFENVIVILQKGSFLTSLKTSFRFQNVLESIKVLVQENVIIVWADEGLQGSNMTHIYTGKYIDIPSMLPTKTQ